MDARASILTFGAATQDIFLTGKVFTARRDVRTKDYVEILPLGSKLEVDQVHFDTGGGATNAAVTFARQGLTVGAVAKIGVDPAGGEVLRILRREGVSIDQVVKDPRLHTGFSTLLVAPSGERTVLVHRGASANLQPKDFKLSELTADWFYISSLGGNLALLSKIIERARKVNAQVALNPGQAELAQVRKLVKILPGVTVLIANKEEMQQMFNAEDGRELLRKATGSCHLAVMTDAAKGSYVCDGLKIYFAGQYQKVRVVDRTGAGDAFGSGFVAGLAQGLGIEDALTLASANATSVVQKIGAKAGILKQAKLRRMKIKTVSIV
jgi:sugar/nucleoside kinase (ribokinase family)